MQDIPDSEQIFGAEESERMTDIPVTIEMVEKSYIDLQIQISRIR